MEIPINIKKYGDESAAENLGAPGDIELIKASGGGGSKAMSGGEIFLDYLLKIPIFLAVLIIPLFFWQSSDTLNLGKQLLLSLFALISFSAWVGKVIVAGKIIWRRHIFVFAIIATALSGLLSAYFSSSFWISFLGDTGRYSLPAASLLSYLVLALTAFQNLGKSEVKTVLAVWLFSSLLVAVAAILHFFKIFVFPFDFAKSQFFNPIGSLSHLALFAAMPLPFIIVWLTESDEEKRVKSKLIKTGLIVIALLGIAAAFMADAGPVWISLIFAAILLVILEVLNPKKVEGKYQRRVFLPLVVMIVSVFLWWMNLPGPRWLNIPPEVKPSFSASVSIAASSLKENWLFGSGPETFPYVYGKFKSSQLNQTNFWGVNFNNSASDLLTWIVNTGIVGALTLLSFIIIFMRQALRNIWSKPGFGIEAGMLASWIFILGAKIFSNVPLPLEMWFWLFPAFILASGAIKEWSFRFESGTWKTLIVICGLTIGLLSGLAGIYLTAERWVGEKSFAKALLAPNDEKNRDETLNNISGAILNNPYEARYYRGMAQTALAKIGDLNTGIGKRPANERQPNANEIAVLQNLTLRAVSSIQRAEQLDPQNTSVLVEAAGIYQALASYIGGTNDAIIALYEKAVLLEPINPFFKTQLAQAYLSKSGLFDQAAKTDDGLVEKAKSILEETIRLNSIYANARFFLGLIYDEEGKREEALAQMQFILNNDPSNETLKQITANLKAGRRALSRGVEAVPPSEPPEASGQP